MKNLFKALFVAMLLMFSFINTFANHILGGEITYKFISRDSATVTYQITLTIYRDPAVNITFGPTTDLGAYEESNSPIKIKNQTITLNKISEGKVSSSQPFNTNCPDTVGYSINQVVYSGNVTLPKSTFGYHVTWDNFARVKPTVNVVAGEGITYYAFIPPTNITNNSAVFSDIPVTAICAGDTISILNSAKDADNDVLKYQFGQPYKGRATMPNPPVTPTLNFPIDTVDFNTGFSYQNPMGFGGYSYLDPFTGVASYSATTIGNYVVLVQVSEYRNGVLVGIVRRDVIVTANACAAASRPGPTYTTGPDKFYVKAGASICFSITFTAANQSTDSLLVLTTSSIFNANVTMPAATLTGPSKDKGIVSQQVCWQTSCAQGNSNPYLIYSSAKDNHCPQIAPVTQTIKVFVLRNNPVITGLNAICPLQKFVKYSVADTAIGSTYTWVVTGGTPNTTTGDSIRVDWNNPSPNGKVMVIETSRLGCKDTTIMTVLIDRTLHITAGANRTVCADDSTTALGPPNVVPGYVYKWSPAAGMNNTNIANPKVAMSNTSGSDKILKYSLYVTTPDGCFSNDTVAITIHSRMPVSIGTSPQTICRYDNSSLTGNGGVSYKWYLQGNASLLSSSNPFSVSPPNDATYNVVATDNNGCTNSASVNITVNQLPTITAFTSLDSICTGGSAQLTGNGGVIYNWYKQSNPTVKIDSVRKFTVSPTIPTTYLLIAYDNNNCKNTSTVSIYVNPLPNIQIAASDDSICPGTSTILTPKNGTSYFWYNAKAPTIPISNDNPFITSPTVTTTYNITGTDVHGCINTSSKKIFVFAYPQTQAIKGSPYVCVNSFGVTFMVPGGSSTSTYQWTASGNATIVSATQGNDTVKVNFGNPDTINLTVRETDINGCLGSILTYKVIIIDNYVPPAAIGKDTLCSFDINNVMYSAPNGSPDFIYQWHITGGSILSGNTTPDVTVKWNGAGTPAGSIYYVQQSKTAVPACFFTSSSLSVTVYPSPTTGPVTGDTSVCKGDKNLPYQVQGFGGSTYSWNVKRGEIIGSRTNSYVYASWDTVGVDTLSVIETTNKGCVGHKVYGSIKVNGLPVAGPINGASPICQSNKLAQTYTSSGLPGSRFVWSVVGGTITSGNNTNTIKIDWNFNSKNPLITVIEISKDSCIGPAVQKAIVEDETDAVLLVTTTNDKNDKDIELTWQEFTRANGALSTYNLLRREYGINAAWQPIANNLIVPNYTDNSLSTHNKIYEYYYNTKDLCNNVANSLTNNTILLGGNGNEASKKVNLKWNNYHNWSRGLNRYEVWRMVDDETDYTFYSSVGKDTSVIFTNGLDGFKHHYRIKSFEDFTGRVALSNDTTITFAHKVVIPNAFSPNGDGVNDRWEIKDVEVYSNTTLQVFDRAGALVYTSQNYKNEWDGRSISGKELPDGTYYYILKLGGKGAFGQDAYNGNVTIVR